MKRFWPAREPAQADYERLREQILLGEEGLDLAALRFRRFGLAGLVTNPTPAWSMVATVVGGRRPRWSGLEDPRVEALVATYAVLSQEPEIERSSRRRAARWGSA